MSLLTIKSTSKSSVEETTNLYMSRPPHGEGNPVLLNPEDPSKEWTEGRNVTQIAQLLASKLTPMEYYDLVLAIEDSDFHEAVLRQWKNMPHPEPIVGK